MHVPTNNGRLPIRSRGKILVLISGFQALTSPVHGRQLLRQLSHRSLDIKTPKS